jgi:hypothetical protein
MVVSHNDPNAQVVLLRPIEKTLAELNPAIKQTHRIRPNNAKITNKTYFLFPRFSFFLFLQHIGQHGVQTQGS